MNTDAFYEPRRPEALTKAAEAAVPEIERSALAHHRDPSLPGGSPPPPALARGRSITWMRPSELVTSGLTPLLMRGVRYQGELVRQARRTPAAATRAGRRITRSAISRPAAGAPTQDGIGL